MKQIFKMSVPAEVLFSFLDQFCAQSERHYVFDLNAFRKMQFHEGERDRFLQTILPYYHKSKQYYVTRKLSYNSAINLVRQICKSNGVAFSKDLCYNHSNYTIIYYISKPARAAPAADPAPTPNPAPAPL